MAFAALRIFIPGSFFTRKGVGEDVGPTVVIEIVGEGEKVVGVGVVGAVSAFETGEGFFGAIAFLAFESRIGGIDFVTICEGRSFVPIRPGDDVVNTIVIEIAKVGALGPKVLGELDFLEGVQLIIGGGDNQRRRK